MRYLSKRQALIQLWGKKINSLCIEEVSQADHSSLFELKAYELLEALYAGLSTLHGDISATHLFPGLKCHGHIMAIHRIRELPLF